MTNPPTLLPMMSPMIAAELMIVLYNTVSSSVQPNFASKISVVRPFPAIAKDVYHTLMTWYAPYAHK